uniref:G-protein coupled receptors family 2 profile 2 domain-containing protein n=1 Tax=Magallana gigas TaxID=29159 RepID=K1QNL4_MAGGI
MATKCSKFTKTCLSNGTWEKKAKLEVDGAHVLYNYTTCKEAGKQTLVVGKEEFRIHTLVTLVTNVISLAFLLPSIVIVALFRYSGSLDSGTRRMFRIRFHFLSSLILVSVVTLAWDWVVGKEHPICKVLIILQLYLRSATYFWMFVEGLNILVPLLQYCFSDRDYDGDCRKTPEYSVAIQLYTVRKSIRSFIFLVLLFGINFIFTWMFYAIYTDILVPYIINRVVDGLQGVFVCILWVFCSKQVQQNFKRAVSRKWSHVFVRFHARKFSTTSSTHLTQAIHPMSVTPIVLDNAKVSEHLKTTREVLEVPEMERLSPDEDRL